MKSNVFGAIAATLLLGASHASSAVITLETRSIDSGFDSSMEATFNNQSSAILTSSLDAFDQQYIGNHSVAHLSVSFDSNSSGSWLFDMGLDAGYGAELYFNDTLLSKRTDDLWWRYDWNNSDVMSVSADTVFGGNTLDLFWAENCCNGYSEGRFSVDGGNSWMDLSVANLDQVTAEVSEPASFALIALGVLGLAGIRQLRSKD